MAFRFRRTIKIAPGIRVNLTKTGVSARVGPRGAGVTVGTSGTTVSAGLPGTGLHMSQKLGADSKRPVRTDPTRAAEAKAGAFGWISAVTIVVVLIWGMIALLG